MSSNEAKSEALTESFAESSPDSSNIKKSTRRAVACKSCHSLKVKCTPADESNPSGPCLRCVKTKRTCEIDLTQPRKKRRTNANINPTDRIAQLEQHVLDLTQRLQEQEKNTSNQQQKQDANQDELGAAYPPYTSPATTQYILSQGKIPKLPNPSINQFVPSPDSPQCISRSDLESELGKLCSMQNLKLSELTNAVSKVADRRTDILKSHKQSDCITKGLITIEEGEERLRLYRECIYPRYRYVDVPCGVSAAKLREKQPFLFNCIMSITNGVNPNNLDIDRELEIDNLAIEALTTEVLVVGTKSTELLKSLLLLCLFYNTPELFRHRRFHLINALCVSMTHDLGLSGRPYYVFRKEDGGVSRADAFAGPDGFEARRLVLVVYFSTISICLFLRRSINVRWSQYVEDSCLALENSDDIECHKIALFARLNHKLDRIHHIIHATGYNQPLDLHSPRSKYVINDFQRELNQIKTKINSDDHLFLAYFYSVEAYLHEPSLRSPNEIEAQASSITSSMATSIARCTSSCLLALTEYTKLTLEEVTSIPLFFSARIIYTAGMLLRLRYLVLSLPSSIERNLVPTEAISIIEKVSKLVDEASVKYKNNNFISKLKLVLSLFVQTYATQIRGLFKASKQNGNAAHTTTKSKRRSKNHIFENLARDSPHLSDLSVNATYIKDQQQPLDILSHAAASHGKSQSPDPEIYSNSQLPPTSESASNPNGVVPTPQYQFQQQPVATMAPPIPPTPHYTNEFNIMPTVSDLSITNLMNPLEDGMDQNLLADSDSLEMSYWALNDEFWGNLLKNGSSSVNFTNNNGNGHSDTNSTILDNGWI